MSDTPKRKPKRRKKKRKPTDAEMFKRMRRAEGLLRPDLLLAGYYD